LNSIFFKINFNQKMADALNNEAGLKNLLEGMNMDPTKMQ